MNSVLLNVILLSPGFIGIAINKLFDGDTTSDTVQNGAMKYFLYSAFSYLIAEMIDNPAVLSKIFAGQMVKYTDLIMPLTIAALLSMFWTLKGKGLILQVANKLNLVCGRDTVFLEKSMSEKVFNDGKGHFIEVTFADGRSVRGMLQHVLEHEASYTLAPDPEWTKDYTEYTVRSLVYPKLGVTIREYDYM